MRTRASKPSPPDPTTPQGWLQIHRSHARPFYEVKVGIWHRWRCPCGEKFHFTEEQRTAAPNQYTLAGGN